MIIIIDRLGPALMDQTAISFYSEQKLPRVALGPKREAAKIPLTCPKLCQNVWLPTVYRAFRARNTFSAWAD